MFELSANYGDSGNMARILGQLQRHATNAPPRSEGWIIGGTHIRRRGCLCRSTGLTSGYRTGVHPVFNPEKFLANHLTRCLRWLRCGIRGAQTTSDL